MNWKSLQKDEDTVVSHLHPLLSVAQSRKRREMDSAASSSHSEGLVGLWQRLFLVAGALCAQGSGRWAPVVPVLPSELHIPRAVSPLLISQTGHWQSLPSFSHVWVIYGHKLTPIWDSLGLAGILKYCFKRGSDLCSSALWTKLAFAVSKKHPFPQGWLLLGYLSMGNALECSSGLGNCKPLCSCRSYGRGKGKWRDKPPGAVATMGCPL